jgi:hypothetical protein
MPSASLVFDSPKHGLLGIEEAGWLLSRVMLVAASVVFLIILGTESW